MTKEKHIEVISDIILNFEDKDAEILQNKFNLQFPFFFIIHCTCHQTWKM